MNSKTIAIRITAMEDGSIGKVLGNVRNSLAKLTGKNKIAMGTYDTLVKAAKVAAKAETAASVASAAWTVNAIKNSQEFGYSMSNVGALTEASEAQLQNLKDTAMNLGETTKFTSSEVADGMGVLAQAGWGVNDIISGTSGVLSLAAASGTEMAEACGIVSTGLSALGYGAEESSHYADVLSVAAKSANQNVSDIGETMKYVGPVAGAMHYNMEDLALSTALMAKASINGSMAGTQLRKMMLNMTTGDKNATKAMQKLGVTMQDEYGNMLPWSNVLEQMRAGFQGLSSDAERVEMANLLGGKTAAAGVLALMGQSNEEYEKLKENIYGAQGAAQRMAEQRENNLQGDVTKLKSAYEVLQLQVAQSFDGIARGTVQQTTQMVQGMRQAIAGGDFSGAGSILGSFVADAVTNLAQYYPVFQQFGHSMLMSIMSGLQQNSGQIGSTLGLILTNLVTGIAQLGPQLIGVGGQIVANLIVGIGENASQIAYSLAYGLSAGISNIIAAAGEIASAIVEVLLSVNWFDVAWQIIKGIGQGIANGFMNLVDGVKSIFSGKDLSFEASLQNKDGSWRAAGQQNANAYVSGFSSTFNGAQSNGRFGTFNGIDFSGAMSQANSNGAKYAASFADGVKSNKSYIGSSFDVVWAQMNSSSGSQMAAAQTNGQLFGQTYGNAAAGSLQASASQAQTALSSAQSSADQLQTSLTSVQTSADQITTAITTNMTTAVSNVTQSMAQIGAATTAGMQQVVAAVQAGMAQFNSAIAAGCAMAVARCRACAAGMRGAFSGLNLFGVGYNAMMGLNSGILAGGSAALATARSIASQISSVMNGALKVNSPSKVTMKTGMSVDEGLIVGMQKMSPDVMSAAIKYGAQPMVTGTGQAMMSTLGLQRREDPIGAISGGTQTLPNITNSTGGSMNITFAPNITINGGSGNVEADVRQAVSLSFDEFKKMMKQYSRETGRVALA